jgi:hypothetical protein
MLKAQWAAFMRKNNLTAVPHFGDRNVHVFTHRLKFSRQYYITRTHLNIFIFF